MSTVDLRVGRDDALHAIHLELMREVRSTAKRVPTDWRERAGYRKGLRQAARIVEELMAAEDRA